MTSRITRRAAILMVGALAGWVSLPAGLAADVKTAPGLGDPGQLVWLVKEFAGLMPAGSSHVNSFTGQTSWRGSISSGIRPF